jgi:hypothetical protein
MLYPAAEFRRTADTRRDHIFDLECIAPWLQLKSTCPLDRKELVTKQPPPPPPPPPADEEEEEEFDDMYG